MVMSDLKLEDEFVGGIKLWHVGCIGFPLGCAFSLGFLALVFWIAKFILGL
jgi:hypothetical protein